MKAPFVKIRITDLDVDLTQPSQEGPGFRRLYLKLSEEPPPEWVKIFEQERRFPPHQTWRKAWVLGAHIVVECFPEELEQFQLTHLKEDVVTVNKKFSECAAIKMAEIRQQLQERAEARRDLENLRTRLRFD
jgi:transposase